MTWRDQVLVASVSSFLSEIQFSYSFIVRFITHTEQRVLAEHSAGWGSGCVLSQNYAWGISMTVH
jgi:hypothetical protein